VANSGNDTVSVFDASLGAAANALRKFGDMAGVRFPFGMAVDPVNNLIFVTNQDSHSVTVYNRTDTGDIAPVRTIQGANTGISMPWGLAIW
jgi:DNA-binding beta-propeller fold protein YncE